MSVSDSNPNLAILLDVVVMGYSMIMGPIWNRGVSIQDRKPCPLDGRFMKPANTIRTSCPTVA